ncbi:MAG: carboxypeptidase regulatory-like domain-containing protein, partial [Planctomycetes bacterium]|nr:carboxypeptidase regulatory-like domain-containing protein [Planctomycetota bacterium]
MPGPPGSVHLSFRRKDRSVEVAGKVESWKRDQIVVVFSSLQHQVDSGTVTLVVKNCLGASGKRNVKVDFRRRVAPAPTVHLLRLFAGRDLGRGGYCAIEGTATYARGAPVAGGVLVMANDRIVGWVEPRLGRFLIHDLEPGDYQLTLFESSGLRSLTRTVTVEAFSRSMAILVVPDRERDAEDAEIEESPLREIWEAAGGRDLGREAA